MTPRSITLGLIEGAIDRVEQTSDYIFSREAPFQWAVRTTSTEPQEERSALSKQEVESRARPTLAAIHFCLSSATAVLKICHSLVDHEGPQSPHEREKLWKRLAVDTKVAGGAAYRAALVLADPSEADQQAPWLSTATPAETQEHSAREKRLRRSELYEHWAQIKAHGVTAQEFTEFLRPMLQPHGVCVSYIYQDQTGREKIFNYVEGDGLPNPMLEAIANRSLSLEEALQYAVDDRGRQWIEASFAAMSPSASASASASAV